MQVCNLFSAGYGIGIAGYASPVPGQNIQKLFSYISIAKNKEIIDSKKINASDKTPKEIQLFYTDKAIRMLIEILK